MEGTRFFGQYSQFVEVCHVVHLGDPAVWSSHTSDRAPTGLRRLGTVLRQVSDVSF